MIGLRITVPFACWRKGMAREIWETEPIPPPATAYGMLLSLVGEFGRRSHIGCRVTTGIVGQPAKSRVLRTLWRVKKKDSPPGVGSNVTPDFQELLTESEVLIWLDSSGEPPSRSLETRVRDAILEPSSIQRSGALSLGESSHMVNDVNVLKSCPEGAEVFLIGPQGTLTLPVWVDHVGSKDTRFVTGSLTSLRNPPTIEQMPVISPG